MDNVHVNNQGSTVFHVQQELKNHYAYRAFLEILNKGIPEIRAF
jgi:hypothetical protein